MFLRCVLRSLWRYLTRFLHVPSYGSSYDRTPKDRTDFPKERPKERPTEPPFFTTTTSERQQHLPLNTLSSIGPTPNLFPWHRSRTACLHGRGACVHGRGACLHGRGACLPGRGACLHGRGIRVPPSAARASLQIWYVE